MEDRRYAQLGDLCYAYDGKKRKETMKTKQSKQTCASWINGHCVMADEVPLQCPKNKEECPYYVRVK